MKTIRQLLIKSDDFLLQRHLKALLKRIVDPSLKDFNFERISANDVTMPSLLERLQTWPMMADSRTIVVEDFDEYGKDDLENLLPVLQKEDLPTHAIFIAEKIDKRTGFYKGFTKVGEVHEFKRPYSNQLPDFLAQEAKGLELTVDRDALQTLVDVVGSDLMALVMELEKLKTYVHPEKRVSKKHVQDLVAQGLVDNVFLLGNLMGQKNLAQALSLFHRMVEQGEPVIKIVALIIGHFRKLFLAKEALSSKVRQPLEQVLGISPYFVKDYEAQSKRFSLQELQNLYKNLMGLSEELRQSRLDKKLLFENFLQSICVM